MTVIILLRASRIGSTVFPSIIVTSKITKSFLAFTPFFKWALFIGYKRRLLRQTEIKMAAGEYFGVPAIGPDMQEIVYDEEGINLHNSLEKSLLAQKSVVIKAKGGGGKTTLLARWSYLCINNKIPSLKGYTPILINSTDYRNNLIESITIVLKEGYRVGVDKDITQILLETRKFLILFDGVSEITGDKDIAMEEILRTARNEEYQDCLFLITTRPGVNIRHETTIYHLQPLTSNVAESLLKSISRSKAISPNILRQLEYFGLKPIEPLLFSMIMKQGQNSDISVTRAQLYKEYFKKIMRINDDNAWVGWNVALENLAKWFSLDTGSRGVGLLHETLIDLMSKKTTSHGDLIDNLNHYYSLTMKDANALLKMLASSGIIQQVKRRWYFVHDTYEEYFIASYIYTYIDLDGKMPDLDLWTTNETQIQLFSGVIEFLKEMTDAKTSKVLLKSKIPGLWKKILRENL